MSSSCLVLGWPRNTLVFIGVADVLWSIAQTTHVWECPTGHCALHVGLGSGMRLEGHVFSWAGVVLDAKLAGSETLGWLDWWRSR